MKVLITYYSRTGNTEQLAQAVADSVTTSGGTVELKRVTETTLDDLLEADAILIGTPVYYGSMAAEVKQLLDQSISIHGKLDGKVGGAFSSSANIAGGNETAILDIVNALLIHGMVIQGDAVGDHYGPVAIGAPDERSLKLARRWGGRVCELLRRLSR